LEEEHLVSHNTDGGIEFHIVLCHFRDLNFHADVIPIMVQNGLVHGPIITNCRRTATFQGPIRSKWSRRTMTTFASQCQFMLELPHVHVSGLVQRRVEVRNVPRQYRLTRFVEVRDLLQHRNCRAVEYCSKLVRWSDHRKRILTIKTNEIKSK
jgi:hypothetical protein